MFKYNNNLSIFNEEHYPYSMEYEKESMYSHQHAVCDKHGFCIIESGSKHLFCTPNMRTFSLKLKVNIKEAFYQFKSVRFGILFGYSKAGKNGYRVDFSYDSYERKLSILLLQVNGIKNKVEGERIYKNVDFENWQEILLELNVKETSCCGSLDCYEFQFPIESICGRIGISVSSVLKGIIFKDAEIVSCESIEKARIYSRDIELPAQNGGLVPYTMHIDIYSYSDMVYEMQYTLSGGISAREKVDMHSDCWLYHYDEIEDLYIKFINNNMCDKYYLFNGLIRFYDSNGLEHLRKLQEYVYEMRETPLSGQFFFTGFGEETVLGVGYADFNSWGYEAQRGAYEYLFDAQDNLIYEGMPLEKDVIAKFISLDKKIISDIPTNIFDYNAAVIHAENNHYFYVNEVPKFQLLIYTKLTDKYIGVKLSLMDAFYQHIADIVPLTMETDTRFEVNEYKLVRCGFCLPVLGSGVYHVYAEILYGDRVIDSHCSALEVLDPQSEQSPQEASGIPTLYMGDAAPPLCESCVPDFYARKSEFDWGHYFRIALYVPISAEKKRVWELLRFYKRQLFTWVNRRTIWHYDLDELQDTLQNSDYINYFYPGLEECGNYYRHDFFDYSIYGTSIMRDILNQFFNIYPHYKKMFDIDDIKDQFTREDMIRLLKLCGSEWIPFAHVKIQEHFELQMKELRIKNPKQKRCSYGPYPIYFAPYKSGYATKWYGFDPKKIHQVFDGFLQYEDYPFSSDYDSYAGAWGVLTTKLLNPHIKIYPELYMSFPEGCPDGAVACAYPPFGGSFCPIHFTMTQMCEYIYNTSFYKDGKFQYWNDYGFSVFSFIDHPKDRSKCILKLWGNVLKYRPVRPYKTIAYLYEMGPQEDRYDFEVAGSNFYNISETNLAYIYGKMKNSGLTSGFAVGVEDILQLTECEINCLVLPDLTNISSEILDKIKLLHERGVTLVAVSKIPGLEDLFGVEDKEQNVLVNCLSNGREIEYITPNQAEFFYSCDAGKVLLWANEDIPVIITNNNCILLNTSIAQVGIDALIDTHYMGRPNISRLLAEQFINVLHDMIVTEVRCSIGAGLTILETKCGEAILMITDYSKHDQKCLNESVLREIEFNIQNLVDVEYINICNDDPQIHKLYQNEILKGMSVMLRPQETFMFRLLFK